MDTTSLPFSLKYGMRRINLAKREYLQNRSAPHRRVDVGQSDEPMWGTSILWLFMILLHKNLRYFSVAHLNNPSEDLQHQQDCSLLELRGLRMMDSECILSGYHPC